MNWGTKIILSFVAFIGLIFTLAYISMGQDINLVADDYYAQELAYEDQIQRIKNTQALSERPTVVIDKTAQKAYLVFPETLKDRVDEGQLQLYRPSNAAFDKTVSIGLNEDGSQTIDVSSLVRGLWKAKITWSYRNTEYYQEVSLVF